MNRDISLDLIRFIAMLMVICIHICAPGFYALFEHHWWAINIYESVSRVSVPLFFMVTGALLLPREQHVKSIVLRVYRVIVPLIAWSFIYLIWFDYIGIKTEDWLLTIFRGPVVAHLWYVYTLIGAYLFLPVMSGFFKINSLNVKLFTLLFWFLGLSIHPTAINLANKAYVGISFDFLSLYAGYMVLGAIIYNNITLTKRLVGLAALTYIVSAMLIAVLTWRHSLSLKSANEAFYVYHSPFVVLGAVAIFTVLLFIGKIFIKEGSPLYKFLIFQGQTSFGVYLVHVLVLFMLDRWGIRYDFINPWLAVPIVVITTFLICVVVIKIVQKIPVVRMIAPS